MRGPSPSGIASSMSRRLEPYWPLAHQVLTVTFTPDDVLNYQVTTAKVRVDVLPTYDFGDAPAPYPTLLSAAGARHESPRQLFLGRGVSFEVEGKPSRRSGCG